MLESVAFRNAVYLERVQEETWDTNNPGIVSTRLSVSTRRFLIRNVQGRAGSLGHSPPRPQLDLYLLHGQVRFFLSFGPPLSHFTGAITLVDLVSR